MEYQFDQDLPEYVNDFFQYLDNEVITTKEKKEEQKMNITVEVKNVYGMDRIYPACGKSRIFTMIANTKTLSNYDIDKIKELGYTVQVKTPTL